MLRRLLAWWMRGSSTPSFTNGVMAVSSPVSEPTPAPSARARCRNCQQETLTSITTKAGDAYVTLWRCDDCDAGHCPTCRAYTKTTDRFCRCGARLELPHLSSKPSGGSE